MNANSSIRTTTSRGMNMTRNRSTICFVLLGALCVGSWATAGAFAGETCADATVLTGPLPLYAAGSTVGMQDDYDVACPGNGGGAPDAVYAYTPAADVAVDILLTAGDTDFDTKLYVYVDGCTLADLVACNDDYGVSATTLTPFVSALFRVPLVAGHTYYIVVDGRDGAAGTYTLDIIAALACSASETLLTQSPDQAQWGPVEGGMIQRFGPLPAPIEGLRFWGHVYVHSLFDVSAGVPTDVAFTIRFYDDIANQPGTEVASYAATLSGTPVGWAGHLAAVVYQFDCTLPEPAPLRTGWIGIHGTIPGAEISTRFYLDVAVPTPGIAFTSQPVDYEPALCLLPGDAPVFGACCDPATGVCEENVAFADCTGRFLPNGTCAGFDPPCGTEVGVCYYGPGQCTETTRTHCLSSPDCLGDMNCDGVVDVFDIDPFVVALWGPQFWDNPDCARDRADTNGDGGVDFFDIDPFIVLMGTYCTNEGAQWLGTHVTCDQMPQYSITLTGTWPQTETFDYTATPPSAYVVDCLGAAKLGGDMVFELDVPAPLSFEIVLDTEYASEAIGLLLDSALPPGDTPLTASVTPQPGPYTLPCVTLDAGRYYLLVHGLASPSHFTDGIGLFTLTFQDCPPPPTGRCCWNDPVQCSVLTEDECLAVGGTWAADLDCTTPCEPAPGEACATAWPIAATPFSDTIAIDGRTADGPAAPCDVYGATGQMIGDVWYVWTPTESCLALATLTGGDFNHVLVVRGNCADVIACVDNSDLMDETLQFPVTAGTSYYFQLGKSGSHAGTGSMTFTLDCTTATGACCFADGSCQELAALACVAQGGDYHAGVDCAAANCPVPPALGDSCDDPIVVTLDAASLPYVDTNTTVGRLDDYRDTALGSYDSGADVIYKFVVTEPMTVSVMLDPEGTPYTGLLMTLECPALGEAFAKSINATATVHGFNWVLLTPGEYYVMVDKWLAPAEIASFTLTIADATDQTSMCCVGGTCLTDTTLPDCIAQGGMWYPYTTNCTLCTTPATGTTCASPMAVDVTAKCGSLTGFTLTWISCSNSGVQYPDSTLFGAGAPGWEQFYALNVTGDTMTVDITGASADDFLLLGDTCPPLAGVRGTGALKGVTLTAGTHYLMVKRPAVYPNAYGSCGNTQPFLRCQAEP